jgi:hypothetical protein
MTNPVLCIRKLLPNGETTNELITIDLNATLADSGKMLAFVVGYAEGLLTFMKGESIPVQVANYGDLNDYEQMRVRESLVVMSTIYTGHQDSPNTNLRLKVKLQLDKVPPEASIYAIGEVEKEA